MALYYTLERNNSLEIGQIMAGALFWIGYTSKKLKNCHFKLLWRQNVSGCSSFSHKK